MFAALASIQMCKVILVCLLSWLKQQQCNYLTAYGQLLLQVSWKCWLVLQPCAHVAHRHAEHELTGVLLSGHKLHFIELLK